MNILEKEVKQIKNENMNLKKIIEQINDLMNVQKKEIDELKKWKAKYDADIENIELKKRDEPMLKNKTIIYKLLYRATEDGNSAESFHRKCDNISGTLTVIKTTKGFRFGGYTEMTWNTNNGETVNKKDKNGVGFCYSLDLFKIYNNTNEAKSTIRCYSTEGTDFYGGDAYFFDIYFPIDTNTRSNTGYTKSHSSFGKIEEDCEINNGESNFLMKELEVFQIIFD